MERSLGIIPLPRRSWVVATQTTGPAKPKIFTLLPFIVCCLSLLEVPGLVPHVAWREVEARMTFTPPSLASLTLPPDGAWAIWKLRFCVTQVLHSPHSHPHTQTHNKKPSTFVCPCVRDLSKRRRVNTHPRKLLENQWSGLTSYSRPVVQASIYLGVASLLGQRVKHLHGVGCSDTISPCHSWVVSPGLVVQALKQWAVSSLCVEATGIGTDATGQLVGKPPPGPNCTPWLICVAYDSDDCFFPEQVWPWLYLQPCGGSLLPGPTSQSFLEQQCAWSD